MAAEKRVTLTVGGQVRTVKTFAGTVGAALARLGVKVGPHDKVLPGFNAELGGQRRIEVRRARNITLVLNGARHVEQVTGVTVGEVMRELAVEDKGAVVNLAAGAPVSKGQELVVRQPEAVFGLAQGGTAPVADPDKATPAPEASPADVQTQPSPAAVSGEPQPKITQAVEKLTSKIPFAKVTKTTDTLDEGIRKLKTAGVDGVKVRTYNQTLTDGKVTKKSLVSTEVTKAPVDEVTLLGTRRLVMRSTGHNEAGSASWYYAPGLTAAHPTLPFGTVVRVTNVANGKQVTLTIADRGPFAQGRVIDLSDQAFKQIASMDDGVIDVKLEW